MSETQSPSPTPTQTPVPSASTTKPAENAVSQSQIKQWVRALSTEKGFEEWKNATWDVLPLGPGTHNWIVTVRKSGNDLGYLIVGAAKNGSPVLVEYGTGAYPLFSLQTLYRSLIQHAILPRATTYEQFTKDKSLKLERYYTKPMEAFWKVVYQSETSYYDAKSGDWLPDLNGIPEEKPYVPSVTGKPLTKVIESVALPEFDPFDKASWITGKPLPAETFSKLKELLHEKPTVTYTAKLYKKQAIYPFAVVGYQRWSNGESYIRLDHDGARYLPFSSLPDAGQFYP